MVGKDGRPLSPLSAAHARAKLGLDPYDEDPSLLPTGITPCPCCGRNFAADRLDVHLEICQKASCNPSDIFLRLRRVWDSQQKRLNATLGTTSGLNSSPTPALARGNRAVSRESSLSRRPTSRAVSTPGEEMPANKVPKWKREHDAFQ
ncbi:MAG: hypothetical protein SGPRY_010643, partial [Prymnesium sp.]